MKASRSSRTGFVSAILSLFLLGSVFFLVFPTTASATDSNNIWPEQMLTQISTLRDSEDATDLHRRVLADYWVSSSEFLEVDTAYWECIKPAIVDGISYEYQSRFGRVWSIESDELRETFTVTLRECRPIMGFIRTIYRLQNYLPNS